MCGGEAIGTLITLRDAESRHQLERQLDLSSRLAAIGRLMGGVAHEIKNPLNAMALHLEVLKKRLEDGDPEIAGNLVGDQAARPRREDLPELQQAARTANGGSGYSGAQPGSCESRIAGRGFARDRDRNGSFRASSGLTATRIF